MNERNIALAEAYACEYVDAHKHMWPETHIQYAVSRAVRAGFLQAIQVVEKTECPSRSPDAGDNRSEERLPQMAGVQRRVSGSDVSSKISQDSQATEPGDKRSGSSENCAGGLLGTPEATVGGAATADAEPTGVEHSILNREVGGSSPPRSAFQRTQTVRQAAESFALASGYTATYDRCRLADGFEAGVAWAATQAPTDSERPKCPCGAWYWDEHTMACAIRVSAVATAPADNSVDEDTQRRRDFEASIAIEKVEQQRDHHDRMAQEYFRKWQAAETEVTKLQVQLSDVSRPDSFPDGGEENGNG